MRRTVGWSSMTRMLGPLRTSGRFNVTAKKRLDPHRALADLASPRCTGGQEYYTPCHSPVIVMGVTLVLLSLGSALPAILEA